VPPVQPAAAAKPVDKKKEVIVLTPAQIEEGYRKKALFSTAGTSTVLGMAALVPNSSMMTTFALSCWVGNSCVQGKPQDSASI
jgi:hypothetical protein